MEASLSSAKMALLGLRARARAGEGLRGRGRARVRFPPAPARLREGGLQAGTRAAGAGSAECGAAASEPDVSAKMAGRVSGGRATPARGGIAGFATAARSTRAPGRGREAEHRGALKEGRSEQGWRRDRAAAAGH